MKTSSHTETSALQTRLSLSEDLMTRVAASIKPKHRAGEIAAIVAESSNPSGT
jgi:hypothetical protein